MWAFVHGHLALHCGGRYGSSEPKFRAFRRLVLQGQFIQTRGPDELDCCPATVLVCPADECHADCFSALGARCFILETNARWAAMVQEQAPGGCDPAHFRGCEPAWLMTRLHREFRRMDALSPLVVEGLALELAGEAARATSGGR